MYFEPVRLRVCTRAILLPAVLAAALSWNTAAAQDMPLGVASDNAIEGLPDEAGDIPPVPAVARGEAPEGSVGGMGDINLYPKRIVIDGRQRIASVGLYNRSSAPGDYEISVTDMLMTPQGQVLPVDNLPAGVTAERLLPASGMLRWSPRRVLLRGSEAQTIRIMARPPADLPDGEYRSHFMVVSVPPDIDGGFTIEEALGTDNGAGGGIGVVIRPRFGISIPVIVRLGTTTLEVGLRVGGLVQTEGGKALSLVVQRSGTRSAFGDVVVTLGGSNERVALVRGIGVYPEVDQREVTIPLDPGFNDTRLQAGVVLQVTFVDDDVQPGTILARQDFVVP